jgi:hypothetical protein
VQSELADPAIRAARRSKGLVHGLAFVADIRRTEQPHTVTWLPKSRVSGDIEISVTLDDPGERQVDELVVG